MFGSLKIPPFNPLNQSNLQQKIGIIQPEGNQYTDNLLRALGLQHIWTVPLTNTTSSLTSSTILESNQIQQKSNSIDGNSLVIDDLDDLDC